MGTKARDPWSWTSMFGRRAARGLQWLENTAGPAAISKFFGGKIRGTQFSGRYVIGWGAGAEGRRVVAELLEQLRKGHPVPLCDVKSYYAAGKRWPLGMVIKEGRLVDLWPPDELPPKSICGRNRP